MMLQRGERIRQLPLVEAWRNSRHWSRAAARLQSFRDLDRNAVSIFFFAMKMPLQFDVNIALAKNFRQPLHRFECRLRSTLPERRSQRSFFSAGEANQTIGMLNKIRSSDAQAPSFRPTRSFIFVIRRQRF